MPTKKRRWALWLTLLYLAAWLAAAMLPGVLLLTWPATLVWKWPACWYPLLFISAVLAMVKLIFRDILWRTMMQFESLFP
ncbi:hypothetical protein LAD59_17460 [Klebsiella pneumoniae]|nr:hypothetical protein [Klebsiella pneumoniae]